MCSGTRIGIRHPTSPKMVSGARREKRTESTRPMLTGKEALYCAAGEKKKRPLASEFEMNMAAWGDKVDTLGYAGRLHPTRRGTK